jgi:glyoxylase-like metal-dependent hydrolase (beta-lactamase superfamily II)
MQIHTIDLHFQNNPHTIAAYLVKGRDGLVLIEPGPDSTRRRCLDGLAALGVKPADIRHVVVTHIHFDHAGSAWWWAEQGAQVYVHSAGAAHLIAPERLLVSARQVYGADMERLWGEIRPIDPQRVTPLADNDVIEAGDVRLVAWDTPGHARHHHCLVLDDVVFAGDVAGVRLPGEQFVTVTGAPPQFDPVAYSASLTRLQEAPIRRLYLTHFGPVDDVAAHLARYREVVAGSAELVRSHWRNGAESAEIREQFVAFNRSRAHRDGVSEPVWQQYELANPLEMSADGIALYWRKQGVKSRE